MLMILYINKLHKLFNKMFSKKGNYGTLRRIAQKQITDHFSAVFCEDLIIDCHVPSLRNFQI